MFIAMEKKLIYAADDEENIREILQAFLEEAGYAVRVFETGDSLLQAFSARPADMVILDIMMPGTDGIGVCKKLREISSVPIIILTAKESEMDYAIGITSGGDDYLIKPFRPSILVMRMKALFRRIEMERGSRQDRETVSFGDVSYSGNLHAAQCAGNQLPLTELELSFLLYMLRHAERPISREEFLNEVWGFGAETETRVTDETVRRIRKKLRAAGSRVTISTVWGFGYRLGEVT